MAFRLPTKQHIKVLPHVLGPIERRLFGLFALIAVITGVWMLVRVDRDFSTEVPSFGGSFTEGILGKPHLVNPLLAVTDADRDLVDLIYAGLMRSDGNGNIVPELAETYEVSEDGRTYTFTLREGATWHDGVPVTAEDVVFTITTAKIPELRSPRRANWEGITVEAEGDRVVKFTIQGKPYAPFITNTTLGILPKHIWGAIDTELFALRESNQKPIGAGPFRITALSLGENNAVESYTLEAWNAYAPRRPYIRSLKVDFFDDAKEMLAALNAGKIDSMVTPASGAPTEIPTGIQAHELYIPKLFVVFYNQSKSPVLADAAVRKAIDAATDREALVRDIVHGYGSAEYDPILLDRGVPTTTQNPTDILTAGGWAQSPEGVWQKKTKTATLDLKFALSTSDNPELVRTAELLVVQWKEHGIEATIEQFDVQGLQTARIRPREYEAVLFGQVIGYQPDPYAFWHSSQRTEGGYNIAMYTSTVVDKLLESIRDHITPEKRTEYLVQFADEFQKDKPALVLFRPHDVYLTSRRIQGIQMEKVNLPSERFARVEDWFIETRKVWNLLINK